jgi:hypothetical protein
MHGLTLAGVLVEEGVSGSIPVEERPVRGPLFAKLRRGESSSRPSSIACSTRSRLSSRLGYAALSSTSSISAATSPAMACQSCSDDRRRLRRGRA